MTDRSGALQCDPGSQCAKSVTRSRTVTMTLAEVLRESGAEPPRNGLLSGMILTLGAAVLALSAGFLVPGLESYFGHGLSPTLADRFLISVLIMAAHKVESYWTLEFDHCPVYLSMERNWLPNVRRSAFVVFVGTFLGCMLLLALTLRSPMWGLLLLIVWGAQGLHELHHLGKSVSRRRYYPGTITGLMFTGFINLAIVPLWFGQVQGIPGSVQWVYYGLQPIVLLAFFLEDRRWMEQFADQVARARSERA
jgi:hypothetical protein